MVKYLIHAGAKGSPIRSGGLRKVSKSKLTPITNSLTAVNSQRLTTRDVSHVVLELEEKCQKQRLPVVQTVEYNCLVDILNRTVYFGNFRNQVIAREDTPDSDFVASIMSIGKNLF